MRSCYLLRSFKMQRSNEGLLRVKRDLVFILDRCCDVYVGWTEPRCLVLLHRMFWLQFGDTEPLNRFCILRFTSFLTDCPDVHIFYMLVVNWSSHWVRAVFSILWQHQSTLFLNNQKLLYFPEVPALTQAPLNWGNFNYGVANGRIYLLRFQNKV